jgi:UDP-N-acetylmuramate dehydrogenase
LLVGNVRELALKIKIGGSLKIEEPMNRHTSFRIGGPADLFAAPQNVEELSELLRACRRESVPVFILGGGSNLLVSDRGIRGMVISLEGIKGIQRHPDGLSALGGTPMDDVADAALREGLTGLEFASSLPGSVGGAVRMNARCFEKSISDVLSGVQVLGADATAREKEIDPSQWGYKLSPFQASGETIVRASFRLRPCEKSLIERQMSGFRRERERRGHFLYPCAGSVFKNNRGFGVPTGKLIDSLGLKGRRIGGAQIAPYHGNIIINTGGASASDVLALIGLVEREVRLGLGLELEREVVLAGEW